MTVRLFALSDLHLSLGDQSKSMEIFYGWEHYAERIEAHWKRVVSADDTVVLAGDTSWGMSLADAKLDFAFLDALPGQKILLKGNHDFWFDTMRKTEMFWAENGFSSLHFLLNNCFPVGQFAVCGTRGWVYDGTGEHDQKMVARECGRLETSLSLAEKTGLQPVVFLHYPPVFREERCDEILEVLRRHNVRMIYYGHIHGNGRNHAPTGFEEIKMRLISCDCVDFTPIFIG